MNYEIVLGFVFRYSVRGVMLLYVFPRERIVATVKITKLNFGQL